MRNSWWLTYGFLMPMVGVILIGVGFYVTRVKFARRLLRKAYERNCLPSPA